MKIYCLPKALSTFLMASAEKQGDCEAAPV